MALSESDKKKLPLLFGILALLGGICTYQFYYIPLSEEKALAALKPAIEKKPKLDSIQPQRPVSLQSPVGTMEAPPKILEYVDGKGNQVTAIVEPEPTHLTSERSIQLTTEDKQIINYLRSNVLLRLQKENEELKNQKNAAKGLVTEPVNANGIPNNFVSNQVVPQDLAGFAEVETVKSTMLGKQMTKAEIEDVFERVKVASISVGANNVSDIDAFVRVDGKLFQADIGRVIGDYEVKEIKPNHISIRYIPGNVTQTIGHSGFNLN